MNPRKIFKIAVLVVTLGALGAGGYFYAQKTGSGNNEGLLQELDFQKTGIRIIPAGWKEYRNELHGFSLLYSGNLAINQFDEGGGASTITFEDKDAGLGFQIFAVPYGEEKISQERFLKDSPLGVMESRNDLKVDGVSATSFYGKNERLGETWEVWFIRHGLLYEVSTTRNLEEWLSDIMNTWLFL